MLLESFGAKSKIRKEKEFLVSEYNIMLERNKEYIRLVRNLQKMLWFDKKVQDNGDILIRQVGVLNSRIKQALHVIKEERAELYIGFAGIIEHEQDVTNQKWEELEAYLQKYKPCERNREEKE